MNNALFSNLVTVFGKVKIANQGERAYQQEQALYKGYFSDTPVLMHPSITGGEEYRVNCPFCNDHGFHLYIHYLYGTLGEDGRPILLAHCFKRCLENKDNRRRLEEMILNGKAPTRFKEDKDSLILTDVFPDLKRVNLPLSVDMSTLPDDHEAVQYLINRGFDRDTQKFYMLHYCPDSDNVERMLRGRIIIPIMFDKKLVGWQARTMVEGVKPKYFTMPGLQKSKIFYNFDNAVKEQFIVITEGVTDSWKVGKCGISLLGKTMSRTQASILLNRCPDKPIFIMLDPDAIQDTESIVHLLRNHKSPVKVLNLRGYSDPGDAPADYLSWLLETEARSVQSGIYREVQA